MNQGFIPSNFGLAAPNDPRLAPRTEQLELCRQHSTPKVLPPATTPNQLSNSHNNDLDDVVFIGQTTQSPIKDDRKGPVLKMKSRPKKNLSFNSNPTTQQRQPKTPPKTEQSVNNLPTTNSAIPLSSAKSPVYTSTASLAAPNPAYPIVQSPTKTSASSNNMASLPVSQTKLPASSINLAKVQAPVGLVANTIAIRSFTPPLAPTLPLNGKTVFKAQASPGPIPKLSSSSNKPRDINASLQSDETSSVLDVSILPKTISQESAGLNANQFSWDRYLEVSPAEIAPKEAFMQSPEPLVNKFTVGMKLEARDPRNLSSWCLASVIHTQSSRVRIRFDGSDNMNDFFELIDSDNIRPYGCCPETLLLPPMAYKGNMSTYPKFVEKQLLKPETILAPADCFIKPPKMPAKNLFKTGMKLEAIDRKNPFLICPATIGEVSGDDVKVAFDGWKGSFDYTCKYYSREIFPINWCHDNFHPISPPNNWENLLDKKTSPKEVKMSPRESKTTPRDSRANSRESKTTLKSSQTRGSKPVDQGLRTPSPPKINSSKKISSGTTSISIEYCDETTIESEVSDDPNRFQCQRTVPYSDWLKNSKNASMESVALIENQPSSMSDSSSFASSFSAACESKVSMLNKREFRESEFSDPTKSNNKLSDSEIDNKARKIKCPKRIKLDQKTDINSYSVADIVGLIKSDESLSKYSDIFEANEIDGKAFILLSTDVMINHMGLKVGPVLKINSLIEQAKQLKNRFVSNHPN